MESSKLLVTGIRSTTEAVVAPGRRHKADGAATAAMLIQIASEMLETSPTLRKRIGITLSDLAAANKIRKELARRNTSVQQS
ncbi:MAG TPA: hypothetical protein VGA96_12700 [Fibrella sp.]|jgi:hypothetical protein